MGKCCNCIRCKEEQKLILLWFIMKKSKLKCIKEVYYACGTHPELDILLLDYYHPLDSLFFLYYYLPFLSVESFFQSPLPPCRCIIFCTSSSYFFCWSPLYKALTLRKCSNVSLSIVNCIAEIRLL